MDAVVYFNVVDPADAIVHVQDYQFAVAQVAQTSLRSIIGKSELDDLLSNREQLNQGLELMIDSPALGWGVHIDRVEIKDVALPETMKRSMSRQAEAERERRARVITADGELQASHKLAEAAAAMAEHAGRAATAAAGDRRGGGRGEELDAGAAVPGGTAAVPGTSPDPAGPHPGPTPGPHPRACSGPDLRARACSGPHPRARSGTRFRSGTRLRRAGSPFRAATRRDRPRGGLRGGPRGIRGWARPGVLPPPARPPGPAGTSPWPR